MVDLHYLEDVATKLKTNRQQLLSVEEELKKVNMKLHELPLKSATESRFAKLVGSEYRDEVGQLESAKERLLGQKEMLTETITGDMASFITEFTSSDLVIPLESAPNFNDGSTIYRYRDGAKFMNVFEILSELLGLSSPIVVKDVMLSPAEIVIKVSDEFEAKKKFINSITEVQRALAIKKR